MKLPERITNNYVFFRGSFLSNWSHSPFEWQGIKFQNSEAALMASKAMLFNDECIAKQIIESNQNPKTSKQLGRQVERFDIDIWCERCYDIMVSILIAKFSDNLEMLDELLSYKNKTIVEASPMDKVWGVGIHWNDDRILDENNWEGLNLLGKSHMTVIKHFE